MTAQEYMDKAEQFLVHTYNRFKIVIEKGDGVYLYDVNGKKYLDFAAGIAVFALGYNNKKYNDALKAQIDKVIHTSNLYYNVPAIEAAQKVVEATGLKKVFFTNSGTEAIEGAIKMAKRYAYDRDGHANHEIIAMNHSFHGRTLGALAVTGNAHYQEPFGPMIDGIKFAEYNNLESVESLITDKTCAIVLETLQGEGGIYPADEEFIKGIRKLCDENDIIMICDEIQCGMGRTGKMFAYEHYGFDLFKEEKIVENVNKVAPYLEEKLDEIVKDFDNVTARRGKGFMQGLVLTTPVGETVNKAIENGLLVISAGSDVLRMVPPLTITKENVDEMIEILRKSLV